MRDLLPEQLPWFVVGPGLGLLVVRLYALANKPLGATGAESSSATLAGPPEIAPGTAIGL